MPDLRKFLFLITASLLFSLSGYSQSYIGVFGGINSSRFSGDTPDKGSYKGLLRLNAGALFDIQVGKVISLGLQPSYSQEGTRVFYQTSYAEEPVDSTRIKLNYFSLPVMVKVTSTNKRFYAVSGVEAGYLLSSSIDNGETLEDIQTDVSEFNIALHFGAGINIPVGYGLIFIELRYAQGLFNLTDEPLDKSHIPRIKTSGFRLLTGYRIPLSGSKNQ